jgi:hypothetical protein
MHRFDGGDRMLTPEEVSAEILRALRASRGGGDTQRQARDEGAHKADVAAFIARASEATLEEACREFDAGHATAG